MLPSFELDDELDALRRARRRHTKKILDVDEAESADLHVVARQLRAAPEHERLRPAPDLDGIIGDESMAADDEIQRALALADAAFADDEYAQAKHVHQDAVDDAARREIGVEDRRQPRHRLWGCGPRSEEWHARAVSLDRQFLRRSEAVGDEEARKVVTQHASHCGRPLGAVERLEIPDLAFAEDEDASAAQIGVEAREREPCFLRVGDRDVTAKAVGSGEELEIERAGIGQIAQNGGDRYAGRWILSGHRSLSRCGTAAAVTVSPAQSVRSSHRSGGREC